jgi:hypothetical protein
MVDPDRVRLGVNVDRIEPLEILGREVVPIVAEA